ncbi:MAG TPA: glucose-6-phosphate dehydrogenase assembly protein OpcA [Thermoanaerobaculia bacterium]|nr:glucose-6-phosphate dehydrogenase assembly protein OpcA [Thermoanaerobaculia bacterium]
MTELPVDYSAIEKSLAELWRSEKEGDKAVTRAALWNVVAHTTNRQDHSSASATLARASESVPQRAIVIRAEVDGPPEIASWISANCHRVGGAKQVCSEEVAIVASGDRVRHIPPLVNALLIPDMPVAVWWLGDLPDNDHTYVERLLVSADRLIVDSTDFDSVSDLIWLREIGEKTFTAPADLNWARLADWRSVTASMFDPPAMREKLVRIRRMHLTAAAGASRTFGNSIEALYYAAWIRAQAAPQGAEEVEYVIDFEESAAHPGALTQVRIEFDDGSDSMLRRDEERGVVTASCGTALNLDSITRLLGRSVHDVIVRQLKRPETDAVFVKLLPIAMELAGRLV